MTNKPYRKYQLVWQGTHGEMAGTTIISNLEEDELKLIINYNVEIKGSEKCDIKGINNVR